MKINTEVLCARECSPFYGRGAAAEVEQCSGLCESATSRPAPGDELVDGIASLYPHAGKIIEIDTRGYRY